MREGYKDCVTFNDELICRPGAPNLTMVIAGVAVGITGVVCIALIYVRGIARRGQTWGRRIVGIKIVGKLTGEPIGMGRALGRTLFAATISTIPLYLGYFWMLWDKDKQTWHDKVVNSVVIKL